MVKKIGAGIVSAALVSKYKQCFVAGLCPTPGNERKSQIIRAWREELTPHPGCGSKVGDCPVVQWCRLTPPLADGGGVHFGAYTVPSANNSVG